MLILLLNLSLQLSHVNLSVANEHGATAAASNELAVRAQNIDGLYDLPPAPSVLNSPHIFSVADKTYNNLLEAIKNVRYNSDQTQVNQSVLIRSLILLPSSLRYHVFIMVMLV